MNNIVSTQFPTLEHTLKDRAREFNLYSNEQRAACVYAWLVLGMDFRSIDIIYLNLTDASEGWQSMGICHYLGLRKQHQGFYAGKSWDVIIEDLSLLCTNPEYCIIYYYLFDYFTAHENPIETQNMKYIQKYFPEASVKAEEWIINSLVRSNTDDISINKKLLFLPDDVYNVQKGNEIFSYGLDEVIASIKSLYDFKCQICNDTILKSGWNPSLSRKSKWRFLDADIHHIHPVENGGPNIKSNMLCVCPSCHRKLHSGEFSLRQVKSEIICKNELMDTINLLTQHIHFIDLAL